MTEPAITLSYKCSRCYSLYTTEKLAKECEAQCVERSEVKLVKNLVELFKSQCISYKRGTCNSCTMKNKTYKNLITNATDCLAYFIFTDQGVSF